MTTRPQGTDASVLRPPGLLERRVSRRGLLTLSLRRSATLAVGQTPEPPAPDRVVLSFEPPRKVPCGACGANHGPGADCPVGTHQQALAREFGRALSAIRPAPILATKELEGES